MSYPATADWAEAARQLEPKHEPFIDGCFVEPSDNETFKSISPISGGTICKLPTGSAQDVHRAVLAARRAHTEQRWLRMGLARRRAVLLQAAQLIDERRDQFALIETVEVGKAISNARREIDMSVAWLRFYAEAIDKIYGSVAPSDGSLMALNLFEPRGVVGAIVPWNFPLANAVMKVAPALAAGNALVLKPSEMATQSALHLAALLQEAGLPDGVLNVVPGLGATVGEALARHMDVDFLSFTGSTTTGRRLMRCSGDSNGKPLMLECGGKSAQIVCSDMEHDLEGVASAVVHDAFWNQGQWCSARSRLIVEQGIYSHLLDAIHAEASKLRPGDPLDPETNFGTISSRTQFERIVGMIDAGSSEGGRPILMGEIGKPCDLSIGPTIFADVDPGATIAREEIFGPVLAVMAAEDFEDAITKANRSVYGLSATIWTRDARRVYPAARRLDAGRIAIRTSPDARGTSSIALAAEPVRASGFGVEKGLEGLRSYCRLKAVELL